MLLGFLIKAAIAAAVVSAIVIYVSGKITRQKIQEELRNKNVKSAMIKAINECDNVVSLKDMDSDQEYEIHGDSVDSYLDSGDVIYC
jgi:fructose-1-phosphate kinase PfkB-like protein